MHHNSWPREWSSQYDLLTPRFQKLVLPLISWVHNCPCFLKPFFFLFVYLYPRSQNFHTLTARSKVPCPDRQPGGTEVFLSSIIVPQTKTKTKTRNLTLSYCQVNKLNAHTHIKLSLITEKKVKIHTCTSKIYKRSIRTRTCNVGLKNLSAASTTAASS